jgi:hypothetical protein
VKDTEYVRMVHQMCPGVYGYAYDDGMGLIRCETTATYEMTYFCPSPFQQPSSLPSEGGGGDLSSPWEAGPFPLLRLPSFGSSLGDLLPSFDFDLFYSDEHHSALAHPFRRSWSTVLVWLVSAFGAILVVTSFVVVAVRMRQRHAYNGVHAVPLTEITDQVSREVRPEEANGV